MATQMARAPNLRCTVSPPWDRESLTPPSTLLPLPFPHSPHTLSFSPHSSLALSNTYSSPSTFPPTLYSAAPPSHLTTPYSPHRQIVKKTKRQKDQKTKTKSSNLTTLLSAQTTTMTTIKKAKTTKTKALSSPWQHTNFTHTNPPYTD